MGTTEIQTEQFDSFVEDFFSEKLERSIVIVGASKIDDILLLILKKYFVDPVDSKKDELLEGDRPLSTFSSRIKTTYRLGLIDKNLYNILEKVRSVRNLCAHKVEFNIKTSPAKEYISDIRKILVDRETYRLTMIRYFNNEIKNYVEELRCFIITICIILEAILHKVYQTKGNNVTLTISKK